MTVFHDDVEAAFRRIEAARLPGDLFGEPRNEADVRAAARTYRRLAAVVHPDVNAGSRRADCTFSHLVSLWEGYRKIAPGGVGHVRTNGVTVTTRRRAYTVGEILARGDIATLYRTVHAEDGVQVRGVLKLPRDPADSDLLAAEAKALMRLATEGDGRFRAYVPTLIETFRHRDVVTGAERRANVLEPLDGFVSLAEVRAAYPGGIDPRDAAWMWRRLLTALGFAHRAGVVHGAVLPEHVLIHPRQHGLVLVDWCHAVTERGGCVPALVGRYADWYPPEVTAKAPATSATDLYLATHCMSRLMADRAPRALRAFASGCTLPSWRDRRPRDAWRLLGELDELLERLYGPRMFRPFSMPHGSMPHGSMPR